jgi:hypothetical protein
MMFGDFASWCAVLPHCEQRSIGLDISLPASAKRFGEHFMATSPTATVYSE